MYFVKSTFKWYKRKTGTHKKQVNCPVDCDFADGENVHVLRSSDFEKYFNPELVNEIEMLKKQNQELQQQIDDYASKDADNKQADKKLLSEFKQQMENQIDKNKELQQKNDELNNKLHDEKDKIIDIQRFNTMLMQDINRKNKELNDYQNEMQLSTSTIADKVQKHVADKYKERSFINRLLNKEPNDLNDGIAEIIKENTPTKTSGFLEIPLNVDDYETKTTNDE